MTLTINLPDEIANRLIALPQSQRDLLIANALSDLWDTEDDLRLAEEVAINRGIAEFETGQTMLHETFTARWDEFREQAR